MLSIGLQESKLVRVLDENSTYGILKKHKLDEAAKYTREDLVKVADEGGVSYTASGSLMKSGENIIIMLTLQKPRAGEVIDPIKVTCQNEAEIYPKTNELVARIKSGMDLSQAQVAADAGREIQQITTSSPEALKYYLESYERFRLMDYPKMQGLLEKAVELDPDFAMAYILLAVTYEVSGNYAKGRELRSKAFDLRDRLPEGDRYSVEAEYYLMLPGEDSRAKSIEAYEKYLEYAPRDAGALQSLGIAYANSGDYAKGLECHLRAYEADPSPQYLLAVMFDLQHTGQLDKAEETLKDFQKGHQGNSLVQWNATFFYINRRKFDQALAEIERGFLLDPSPDWSWDCFRGDVYLARGDLAEAEKEYLRVIAKAEKPDYILHAKGGLIALYILQGKTKRAAAEGLSEALAWRRTGGAAAGLINACLRLKNFNKASEYIEKYLSRFRELKDPPGYRKGLWWKGIAAVEKHDLGEAEKIAEELKGSAQKSPYKNEMQRVEHLQGLIDLEKGEYAKAIDNLKKACSWVPFELLGGYMETQALHYYPLAFAYFKAGDLPKARAEFERVTTLIGGKFWFGDLHAKSFYWLGKIAEEQKDKRRAAENYGKFLDLWKDADPGQHEVDGAKACLASPR